MAGNGFNFHAMPLNSDSTVLIVLIRQDSDVPLAIAPAMEQAAAFLGNSPPEPNHFLEVDYECPHRNGEGNAGELLGRFNMLSRREKQVMALVCSGLMNKQIAAKLAVSEITVKVHRHNVMKKIGAKSLPQLVRMADTLGLSFGKLGELPATKNPSP